MDATSAEQAFKIVTLLRLVAFMVIVYLGFGLVVERFSRKPDSQLKAFARTVCSPVTRPVARWLGPGSDHWRILVVSIGLVTAFWVVTIVAARALAPG